MKNDNWRKKDFSEYDVVYHVAGIAHADVGNVSDEVKEKYYIVNTDLAIENAAKANFYDKRMSKYNFEYFEVDFKDNIKRIER